MALFFQGTPAIFQVDYYDCVTRIQVHLWGQIHAIERLRQVPQLRLQTKKGLANQLRNMLIINI